MRLPPKAVFVSPLHRRARGWLTAPDSPLERAPPKEEPPLGADARLGGHKAPRHLDPVDESKGTAAKTRVLITSGDGDETWGTVGVAHNIIDASWQALVDSVEYKLRRADRLEPGR